MSYERRDVSRTYLRLDCGTTLEDLALTMADARYQGMTWEEVADFRERRALASALGQGDRAQSRAELNARLDANRAERERIREEALGPHGGPKVVNIRDARRNMKREERAGEVARWEDDSPLPSRDRRSDDEYIPYPD